MLGCSVNLGFLTSHFTATSNLAKQAILHIFSFICLTKIWGKKEKPMLTGEEPTHVRSWLI